MKGNEEIFALRTAWYERCKVQTLETLPEFLKDLSAIQHDYNTIVYAVAAAAVGAAWALERGPCGGITGFQAGAVMWEFMEAWNGVTFPVWLLKGEDLLYPQHEYKFGTIHPETWKWLQEEAKKKIAEKSDFAHPEVLRHWQTIADGDVPFGLVVRV